MDALQNADRHIGRIRPLTRYPCLVFYVEWSDHVDAWRELHGQRDIPAWMQEPGDA